MSDFFDKRAGDYEDHMHKNLEEFDKFYQSITELIPPSKENLNILDLGVGTGLELDLLMPILPLAEWFLVDISNEMLSKLKSKFTSEIHRLHLLNCSYLEYDFPSEYFDYIITVQSLHHLLKQDKIKLYKCIHSALKPEGLFIEADFIVDPETESEYLEKYHKLVAELEDVEPGQYHIDIPFSWKTTESVLKQAGLKPDRISLKSEYAVTYSAKKIIP